MNNLNKILLTILLLSLVPLIISGFFYFKLVGDQEKNENQNKTARQKIIKEIEDSTAGEIARDGYLISYNEDLGAISVVVTEGPFDDKKRAAEKYLSEKGLDLRYENISFVQPKNTESQEIDGACLSNEEEEAKSCKIETE